MLNPLLIQLFGREVIETLAGAGFESCASIADAGVERLAEESGITPILARRIIAVAMEEPREADDPSEAAIEPEPAAAIEIAVEPEAPVKSKTAAAPRATSASKSARKRPAASREQERRRPAVVARPTGAAANAGAKAKAATEPKIEMKPPEPDPFVDEVGLVRWMGLAGMGGGGLDRSITVADEILDSYPLAIVDEHHPAAPSLASSEPAMTPAAGTPPAVSGPPTSSGPPAVAGPSADVIPDSSRALAAALFAALADEPAMKTEPATPPSATTRIARPEPPAGPTVTAPARPVVAAPARPAGVWQAERATQRPARQGANTALVAGSFWNFGAPLRPKSAEPVARPPSPPGPPRRRSQDGH